MLGARAIGQQFVSAVVRHTKKFMSPRTTIQFGIRRATSHIDHSLTRSFGRTRRLPTQATCLLTSNTRGSTRPLSTHANKPRARRANTKQRKRNARDNAARKPPKPKASVSEALEQLAHLGEDGQPPANQRKLNDIVHTCVVNGKGALALDILARVSHVSQRNSKSVQLPRLHPSLGSSPQPSLVLSNAAREIQADAEVYGQIINHFARSGKPDGYAVAQALLAWVHCEVMGGRLDLNHRGSKMAAAWLTVANQSGRFLSTVDLLELLDLFPDASEDDSAKHTQEAAASVFKAAILASGRKRVSRAEQILALYESKGFTGTGPSEAAPYAALAQILTAAKQWEKLQSLLQHMKANRVETSAAYDGVFAAVERGVPAGAAMRMRKLSPSQLQNALDQQPAAMLRTLLHDVQDDASFPTSLFNNAISALSKLGDCDGALRALQLGQQRIPTKPSEGAKAIANSVPSRPAVHALLLSSCAFDRFDIASGLLELMQTKWGLKPSPKQFKVVLSALSKQPADADSNPSERSRALLSSLENSLKHTTSQQFHAEEAVAAYDCYFAAMKTQAKSNLWEEAARISGSLPAALRNPSLGQSVATLYTDPATVSTPHPVIGAEECDVKMMTYLATTAFKHQNWDAVLDIHRRLATIDQQHTVSEDEIGFRRHQAFKAFSVPYFRAVAAAAFRRRQWSEAIGLRQLLAADHPARGCVQIAGNLLYAAERLSAVDVGLDILGDLRSRKRRIMKELPVASAIRLLEKHGGMCQESCLFLDKWLNDYAYGHVKAPGYDTFQSVARACLADGRESLSRDVIVKRKRFHAPAVDPTTPKALKNLF